MFHAYGMACTVGYDTEENKWVGPRSHIPAYMFRFHGGAELNLLVSKLGCAIGGSEKSTDLGLTAVMLLPCVVIEDKF